MGKSKIVGNKKYIINITKTENKNAEERKKLWIDINETLIPKWLEKSEVYYTLDEKKAETYREAFKFLFQERAINISALKDYIKTIKGE